MTAIYFITLTIFLVFCAFLCMVILIQESKSMGLGATFGGEGGDSLFGTATADILRKITAYMATAFLVGCVFLSFWTSAIGSSKTPSKDFDIETIGE